MQLIRVLFEVSNERNVKTFANSADWVIVVVDMATKFKYVLLFDRLFAWKFNVFNSALKINAEESLNWILFL